MKSSLIFAVMFSAVVFAGGCIQLDFLGTRQQEATAFAGGTSGLTLAFQDLPTTILTNVAFDIKVIVENAGEFTIPQGAAVFTLNNAELFSITNSVQYNNLSDLDGVRLVRDTIIPGGRDLASWRNAIFKGVVLTEQQLVPIAVDACYPYMTTAVSRICVAADSDVCEPSGIKTVENSGAPVQVSNLRQVAQQSGNNIELGLLFDVTNNGNGDAFAATASCPSPDATTNRDTITIKSLKVGNKIVSPVLQCDQNRNTDCCSEPELTMFRGSGSDSCRVSVQGTGGFEEQLSIELEYKYKDRITAQIAVIPQ
jgi:hypothetical protein